MKKNAENAEKSAKVTDYAMLAMFRKCHDTKVRRCWSRYAKSVAHHGSQLYTASLAFVVVHVRRIHYAAVLFGQFLGCVERVHIADEIVYFRRLERIYANQAVEVAVAGVLELTAAKLPRRGLGRVHGRRCLRKILHVYPHANTLP